ncbi:MAG: hypothetical protein JSW02_07620 [candidate division WOR-3 bacterium]|nr:MAG: hypothetical protein JSW02_07620 [candidate division WOR-3 bacterium]
MVAILLAVLSTSGVNSLLLPSSPSGVTTSFSASQDAEAIFYNPANFEGGENYRIWTSYNRFYLDMQSVSLAVVKRIKSIHLGIGFINFDYGDIELRPDYPTEDSVAYYSANDFSIILGASANLSPEGRIGLNVKYISESIYMYSDYGIAFDLSFAYKTDKAGITLGAANFGSRITLRNQSVNLPARLSAGLSYRIKSVTTSADVHYLINNGVYEFGVGLDVPVHDMIIVSGGVNYRESPYPAFGLSIMPGALIIKYGGSFYPKDLGMINSLGIGFEF